MYTFNNNTNLDTKETIESSIQRNSSIFLESVSPTQINLQTASEQLNLMLKIHINTYVKWNYEYKGD